MTPDLQRALDTLQKMQLQRHGFMRGDYGECHVLAALEALAAENADLRRRLERVEARIEQDGPPGEEPEP